MEFKSVAIPKRWAGITITEKKLVVPNQAMSLHEILERFTRNEQLPIGKETNYDDGEDDLEKMVHLDLVDRAEYVEKLEETQKMYKRQEAQREKAAKDKIAVEFKQKVEDDLKRASEKLPKAE